MTTKIGVFDSGVGGLSVAQAIEKAMPYAEVVFMNDVVNVPYGDKPMKQVEGFVVPILQELVDDGCQLIVIACNTVTTNLIDELREIIPVPLVGMEPMVKSAAKLTKTKVIAVCATPATLKSNRYQWLKDTYAEGITVLQPDCSNWSRMIEANQVDHDFIDNQIIDICHQGADVIVLGCTHYHWIEQDIKKATHGRAEVLQPEAAIVKRVQTLLDQ